MEAKPIEPPRDGFAGGAAQEAKKDRFASDTPSAAATVKPVAFDGQRAMKYLRELCAIGTRISGSDGMRRQQEIVIRHFEALGGVVTRQEFKAKAKSEGKEVPMTNIIAKWYPEKSKRIILCAHYDTRPQADEEEDRTRWRQPFLSANDGTSGVAFLMEMAHHLKDLPCAYGIDIVLFDGEEYIFKKGQYLGDGDDFFHGSLHFADEWKKNRRKVPYNYEAAVLFDLFAAKDARLAIEMNSLNVSGALVNEIWNTAAEVKSKRFVYERGFRRGMDVLDDHIQLQQAAIPAVDIIDFDYKHWHKLSDLPDECSAETMSDVALVITTWLQKKK